MIASWLIGAITGGCLFAQSPVVRPSPNKPLAAVLQAPLYNYSATTLSAETEEEILYSWSTAPTLETSDQQTHQSHLRFPLPGLKLSHFRIVLKETNGHGIVGAVFVIRLPDLKSLKLH